MVAGLAIPAVMSMTATAATTPTQGIDVSSLQHPGNATINWSSVASAGKAFTGIKASEGNYYTNPFYANDVAQAVAAGLYVSPYVFANPYGAESNPPPNGTAAAQADYAWNNEISKVTSPAYGSSPLMLPMTVDLEADPYVGSETGANQCYGLSQANMQTWIGQFLAEAKAKTGKTPIIYTSADWWNACTGNYTGFSGYPLWLASYGVSDPALPAGWNNFTIWQYSGGSTVSGISASTDLDELGPVIEDSQVNKPAGSVQLRTLGSLASPGTAVTYSVTSGTLPPGLSLSQSGLISGTPTLSGQYSVTVTPSSGAAIPITWNVHGITVTSPGNRTTTAGTPIWLRVLATDADTGYTASFTASGLPPGLSINSGGIVSGWPYSPGTYHVTVTASDALNSASTAFTWTVSAAPASGAAGTIKQWGGSNKCLDDSGYGKAAGSHVDLWSCTGAWNQNWMFRQDGTVSLVGYNLCLGTVASGTTTLLQLATCNSGNGAEQWEAATNSQLYNPQSGKCLYVPSTNAPNGTRPQLNTCDPATANDANFHWLRPAASVYSGNAGKCLALSGTTVVSANCANTSTQHWSESWNGTFVVGSSCLTAKGTTVGSGVSAGSCTRSAANVWRLISAGPVATELANGSSGLCVTSPNANNGVALQLEPCTASDAATWHAE